MVHSGEMTSVSAGARRRRMTLTRFTAVTPSHAPVSPRTCSVILLTCIDVTSADQVVKREVLEHVAVTHDELVQCFVAKALAFREKSD